MRAARSEYGTRMRRRLHPFQSDPGAPYPKWLEVRRLGRIGYREGLELQRELHAEVLRARETATPRGFLLLLEHDPPVVTVSRRPGAAGNLIATEAAFAERGIRIEETDRGGDVIAYALDGLQDRGQFFVPVGTAVYTGMIVGENNRDGDLELNVCRAKKLTNMRASGRDDNAKIAPPKIMSLEECLEYVEDDELLEVTPKNLRLRKRVLAANLRKR